MRPDEQTQPHASRLRAVDDTSKANGQADSAQPADATRATVERELVTWGVATGALAGIVGGVFMLAGMAAVEAATALYRQGAEIIRERAR